MSRRLALLLLLFPAQALAASGSGGHAETSWTVLGLHALNFAFLLFLLYRFARKPILDFLAQRSQNIRSEIEAAEGRLRDAEHELSELRARLTGFEQEARELTERAAEQAEHEKAAALARARETVQRIREDAQRVAGQEVERARQQLRAEAAQLATSLAGEILRESLTPDDDKRLVGEFIERLGVRE